MGGSLEGEKWEEGIEDGRDVCGEVGYVGGVLGGVGELCLGGKELGIGGDRRKGGGEAMG